MTDQRRDDWTTAYAENPIEEMPWYFPDLDLDKALHMLSVNSGSFLDLGTGPGAQAIEIDTGGGKRGFSKEMIEKIFGD